MVLFVGDRILDLQAFVYAPANCPYIPINGFNHTTHGVCDGVTAARIGLGRHEDKIWDFTYITFDSPILRVLHTYHFWDWRKFNQKLEAEMQSEFAKLLQVTPFESAVIESGVEVNKRGVSPETEAELSQLVRQAGGQMSIALFSKISARAKQELAVFIQNNQSGLRAVGLKMGVKL